MSEQKQKTENEFQLEYLQDCANGNMEHARHVDNERLNFTSLFFGLVMAVVAIIIGVSNGMIACVVTGVLLIFAFIGLRLNTRWQSVFDEHIHRAKFCQEKWLQLARDPQMELSDAELAGADHVIASYVSPKGARQHLLQLLGYSVLDLQAGKKPKAKDLLSRTRHMFAWIYILVVVLLLGLLVWFLTGHGGGGGFDFNIKAVDELEKLIAAVLEASKK